MDKAFLIRVIFLCLFVYNVKSDCIWYGQCGSAPDNQDHKLNCPYSGKPKPFKSDAGRAAFQRNCPDLYTGKDVQTCCSDSQIITLDSQVAVPRQSLQRCPSCYHNFLNIWCYLTCGADQANWMTADKFLNISGKEAISEVSYYLTPDFAVGMFNSCRNVQMPSSNSPALNVLCGTTADKCTPQKWLDYMGSTSNGQAPFDIHFKITNRPVHVPSQNETLHPLNATTFPCNKVPNNDSSACSCQDCIASCAPQPPPPAPAKPCEIAHIDCYAFGFGLFFIVFLVCFGIYNICYNIVVQDSLRLEEPGELSEPGCCGLRTGSASGRHERKRQYLENISADHLGKCETFGARTETFLENVFRSWGYTCASRPFVVIVVVLVISGILCGGIALFSVTTDPVKLWSASDSRARLEKEYFDSHFVPFYRTEQIIISRPHNKTKIVHNLPSGGSVTYNNIFDKSFLHEVLNLQDAVQNLKAVHDNKTVMLEDICFAPLLPDNKNCTIQSILNYYQNSHANLDKFKLDQTGWLVVADYLFHFDYCVQSPTSLNDTNALHMPCLGTYGGPVFPWVGLGGFEGKDYRSSQALIITFVVNNHLDEKKNAPAESWESEYIEFMKNYSKQHPDISISFSSERSIEDEINRESASDVSTILYSYLIMFGYITLTLGRYVSVERILIEAKVTLGLAGVLIVLLSVGASLGLYSYLGVASTLIIIEVVPFLVLAVGVDNIFIIVQTYQRQKLEEGETVEHLIARVVGKVGPSMLLTSSAESLAFFLGALTPMPAVRVFSLYAAMAVLIDFLLQISIFISLLCLDAKREQANRIDAACCVKFNVRKNRSSEGGILYQLVKYYYSPFILAEWVRPVVMIVFVGVFCMCGAMVSKISIGLDQSLSMPKDSYVLNYFHDLTTYLSVGAPVYFVVQGGQNFSSYDIQNNFCGVSGCPQDSLVQQINHAALLPNYTKVAQPVSSWLDDYIAWTTSRDCCRYHNDTGSFCPSASEDPHCVHCKLNHLYKGRPVGEEFDKYLTWFLRDNPGLKCAKGGHAAYASAVELMNNSQHESIVGASYYMTYHSILKTSKDYINALKEAREIADNISLTLNLTESGKNHTIFPYSVFYVFYEQYLTIVNDSALNLGVCMIAIFIITFILLGLDLYSAIMVVVTIIMILTNMMGMMYMWDIDLNAISLVNLIMAIGISVEFTAHIVRAFAISILPTRKERAKEALVSMGSSVMSGITLTKLVGISVLAFSKSQLFQVFYFRMYMGMVTYGATHGLIFLPVMLSYFGPPVNKAKYFKSKTQEMDIRDSQSFNGHANHAYDNPPAYDSVAPVNR